MKRIKAIMSSVMIWGLLTLPAAAAEPGLEIAGEVVADEAGRGNQKLPCIHQYSATCQCRRRVV